MKTAAALQLAYRVTISCEENDDWPPLVTGRHSAADAPGAAYAAWLPRHLAAISTGPPPAAPPPAAGSSR